MLLLLPILDTLWSLFVLHRRSFKGGGSKGAGHKVGLAPIPLCLAQQGR